MRVLVTGGAGYIGSCTAARLAKAGFDPVVFDNLSTGHADNVRWGPLVVGDLQDSELLRRTVREHDIEAAVHFAASAYVGESMQQPGKYFRNNVAGSLALLEALQAEDVGTIVFSSTCATYGLPEHVPIDETHPQQPVNPYGESKLFVEKALRWYGAIHGTRWLALRYFNVAGADTEHALGERHEPETHLIPLVIEAALGRRSCIEVLGTDYATADGTAVRDYVHVVDLAEAHVAALRLLLAGGESRALNLGTGRGFSVREVIDAVRSLSGRDVPVREAPRRPGDPPVLVADATLAGTILGWQPRAAGLEQIVTSALAWHTVQPRIHARD
ncbi:MAG TPA: UDP-glucose 4-epimerase GalE [Dehalococcoidia bacterium]|nr:UDP-glucose 4-epimerase GalE [Dehalococcoidia bacterium]